MMLTLLGALAFHWAGSRNHTRELIAEQFKGMDIKEKEPDIFRITDEKGRTFLIYPGYATGWGGPMTVIPVMTRDGVVERVWIPEHRETPSFFSYIEKTGFLRKFEGWSVNNRESIPVDGISGATLTSAAIAEGVGQSMAKAGRDLLGIPVTGDKKTWKLGRDEVMLASVYLLLLTCRFFRFRKIRLVFLGLGFLFFGIYMNRPVSVSNIASFFMGHGPGIRENLFWWMLVPGMLLMIAILGKNLYCTWICPFGAIQEFIHRTAGLRVSVPKKVQAGLRFGAKLITWLALFAALLSGNASKAAVEPFATLFSLKGSTLQWYLISVVLAGSIFIPRFWCRFFCPAGVCFNQAAGIRRKISKFRVNRKSCQCDTQCKGGS